MVTTQALLAAAGRDPTTLVGGRVAAWGGNLLAGSDRLFIVEADEYDRSFLALSPTVAVVTNIEADHLDIYADLADIQGAFALFVRGARTVVLCGDDPGANSLPTPSTTEVIRYGIESGDARLVAAAVRNSPAGSSFDVRYDDDPIGAVALSVHGRHNVLNALAAIAAGLSLGAPFGGLARGLGEFHGVERRFQRIGEARGVIVVDDYAHHPTEIAATLAAARVAYPGRRIIAAFQPHLYSRTRDFAGEFAHALAAADLLFLSEIYPAREQPIAGVTSALIADAVLVAGGRVAWRGDRTEMALALADVVREGDVVFTIGAGDITKTGPELLRAAWRGLLSQIEDDRDEFPGMALVPAARHVRHRMPRWKVALIGLLRRFRGGLALVGRSDHAADGLLSRSANRGGWKPATLFRVTSSPSYTSIRWRPCGIRRGRWSRASVGTRKCNGWRSIASFPEHSLSTSPRIFLSLSYLPQRECSPRMTRAESCCPSISLA